MQHQQDFLAEIQDHCQQGSEVHGKIEGKTLIGIAKDIWRQNEVGRAGYGQEFCKSLYQCQNDYLYQVHDACRACLVNKSGSIIRRRRAVEKP